MGFKDLNKYADEVQNYIYKCKCGHSVLIRAYENKSICFHCNRTVYRNPREEFIDRLETKLYGRKDKRRVRK